ncbi:hypothetical protein HZA57_09655 [Candidatus Poribacteria bacterium]|nr:hypothetical protein [Candidatus Poribacteria bacterium]
MLARRHRRGSMMLALAALVLILGALCATALVRSLDAYRASRGLERRLQLRAAAEGAVVLLESGTELPLEPVQIGDCRVTAKNAEDAGDTPLIALHVESISGAGDVVMARDSVARFRRASGYRKEFAGWESAP